MDLLDAARFWGVALAEMELKDYQGQIEGDPKASIEELS